MSIRVIDYGAGNLWSIRNGFKRIGVSVDMAEDPEALKDASGVILPGVGSFGDAMKRVEEFRPVIMDVVESGIPFMGVCLGIQLIFNSSGESPEARGLGLFNGTCKRFAGVLKVPHMGWNSVRILKDTPLLEGVGDDSFFYFVHSYYPEPVDRSIIAGETEYGTTFPAIISKDNIHATQFHPEKSGETGLKILENFARMCR
ncbi:MAG: imidazole glycerol phosphate synthase subunit HisH [Candidatus Altiarchaeota archaeon]